MPGAHSSLVAHALLRAASALMPTPGPGRSVEMSLDTARTSAQCHLVFLPSSDGKAIATSPHLSRIRAAFGALGKPALGHQVDDVFQLLLFLFGPTGGQNLGISVEHDVAGIGEAQLSSIDFGALRSQEHDRTHQ